MPTKEDLLIEYPNAYEDELGWIWTSREAASEADWEYAHGDAFLEGVIGYDWDNATENYAGCLKLRRKRAFWSRHPHLHRGIWFVIRHYRFVSLFSRTVWRDWYGRISWATAWKIASDTCLKDWR